MSQPSSPQVDVVIVAHNAGGLLRAAVDSAAKQAGAEHVWVMDAESIDGSTADLGALLPESQVRAVPNKGFSASNNRGIELSDGEYVLLLNPDAELLDGALATLVTCAENNPRAAVVGPAVLNPDGSVQANSRGRFPSLANLIGLNLWRVWQRLIGNATLSPRLPRGVAPVDWVTGACMLVRRSAIQAVGMLDEGFFLYWEDVEWCHRMRDAGWDILLEPGARVIHHLGKAGAPRDAVDRMYLESLDHYLELYPDRPLKWALDLRYGRARAHPGGA
jgi:N-acetylglucosaminyl-diphospho-decaprenol L-rhamnosyltransferase